MNFASIRQNMVDCQIYPGGVVDPALLDAFRTVPRDRFVMPGQEGIAHSDEDLPIGTGRWLMEPLTHARLLQAALPGPDDVVLDIGGATGYPAAILSRVVSRVVAVETSPALLSRAGELWKVLGYTNITAIAGPLGAGAPGQGPYTLIVLNGGAAVLPPELLDQLAVGGRMVAVMADRPECTVGQARLIERTSADVFSDRPLFDAAVPCLPEFAPRREFIF
jgi:protein-L-isoaspartate(D-aspartate) O-methyltransferase